MSLPWLIQTYGYPVLLVGTFLEGETFLVAAGFAANERYLHIGGVLAVASIGAFLGDQMWFAIGRRRGRAFVEARPHWQRRAVRVEQMLHRHEMLVLIGFRFLYGFRTVTPLIIGATHYSAVRFMTLNALGSVIWATIIGLAGFLFGNAMELLLTDIKRYESWLLLSVGIVGMIIWIWRQVRDRRAARAGQGVPPRPPERF